MRLTNYSDYALRVLIYLALKKENELSTIKEIAEAYNISKNHLMKIIHELGVLGYLKTTRGRNGGIMLGMPPNKINIGVVVSHTEEDFHLVDCFHKGKSYCSITPDCKLKHVLADALQAFLNVLMQYTLEDLITNKDNLYGLLHPKNNN